MKILFCCEHYAPNIGGVQKVVQAIAESLSKKGHDVSIATSYHSERLQLLLNGVKINQFQIRGNLVHGLEGDLTGYQTFVLNGNFDAILVYAAQQWTFDALFPVIERIKARLVHVPCGYSGLYDPAYAEYFAAMPAILKQFSALIFHSEDYRDYHFARENNISGLHLIQNGASREEFENPGPRHVKALLGIKENEFVFLTVGNPPMAKGHAEVAQAYAAMESSRPSVLILNGHYKDSENPEKQRFRKWLRATARRFLGKGTNPFFSAIKAISKTGTKRVILCDLPRQSLIQLFFEADLFVFASHIEYSPLVLFEAAAAGLPFLTGPVGNSEEIVLWTGGGLLARGERKSNGRSAVDVAALAESMGRLIHEPERLDALSKAGRASWLSNFTFEKLALRYEAVLLGNAP